MSKKTWLEIAGFVLALLTLFFGNNICQQITGHSVFDGIRRTCVPNRETQPTATVQQPPPMPYPPPPTSNTCTGAVSVGPWYPDPVTGRGQDVTIDSGGNFVHADFWRPGGPPIKEGFASVSVIFPPGTKVTVVNVAGAGWKFDIGCTQTDVEKARADHIARVMEQGGSITAANFSELPIRQMQPTVGSTPIKVVSVNYPGWVICWHGGSDHEYLVAYPEPQARSGIRLNMLVQRPWDNQAGYILESSLKMCLVNGVWYGTFPTFEWFPWVRYMRVGEGQIVVCENIDCANRKWVMLPDGSPAAEIVSMLRQPSGSEIQILGAVETNEVYHTP